MERCLQLAEKGFGKVFPNPMVGCVIVREGKIIGEGYHREFGGPHAEVEAVKSLSDISLLKDSTVYVSLEPCSHHGKTPPCADMLIAGGCRKVVIGVTDPNPLVGGKGIRKLEEAGIITGTGVMEKECRELNRRFFTFHIQKRPYVILKWAETADGYMGGQERLQISGQEAMRLVHRWRSEEHAFMVGTDTLISDNPQLNTRYDGGRDPVRIAVDMHLRSRGMDLHFYRSGQRSILLNGLQQGRDGDTEYIRIPDSTPSTLLTALYGCGIQSVVIEGGRKLLDSFIEAGLYDEVRRFRSKHLITGSGTKAPRITQNPVQTTELEEDVLYLYA